MRLFMERRFTTTQLENLLFRQKDAAGRDLYFPLGRYGRGYVVATPEQRARIVRRYVVTGDATVIFLSLVGAVMVALGVSTSDTGLALVAVMAISIWLGMLSSTGGLERSADKMTRLTEQIALAQVVNRRTMLFGTAALALFFLGHAYALVTAPSWHEYLAVPVLGLGLAGCVRGIYLLRRRPDV